MVNCPGCIETRKRLLAIKSPSRANCDLRIRHHGTVLIACEPNGIRSDVMRNSSMPYAAFHSKMGWRASTLAEASSRILSGVAFFSRQVRLGASSLVLMQA
jgi:hypothetical protein